VIILQVLFSPLIDCSGSSLELFGSTFYSMTGAHFNPSEAKFWLSIMEGPQSLPSDSASSD